jgi:multimeric flavodoxin WrbA
MFLLGLSGGRVMGNSEALLRTALLGAKETGDMDIELIRLAEINVKPPQGHGTSGRMGKDHIPFLNKKIKECDGIILSCPSYALTPPGFTIAIRDRVSLRGLPQKIRPAGMIGVGGSDWTSLMLPIMYTILPHGECVLVDQMLVNYEAPLGKVVMNDKAIARARALGRNVGLAMKMPIGEAKYLGDEKWVCPLCRQNLLIVRDGKTVECAICDVRGELEVKGGKIEVKFSAEALKTYRWGPAGAKRHNDAIRVQEEPYKQNLPEIQKRLNDLEARFAVSKPPQEEEDIFNPAAQPQLGKTLLDFQDKKS